MRRFLTMIAVAWPLGFILATLKLHHVITWSWWWVGALVWVPALAAMMVMVVFAALIFDMTPKRS